MVPCGAVETVTNAASKVTSERLRSRPCGIKHRPAFDSASLRKAQMAILSAQ